jgi:hypothetical protein
MESDSFSHDGAGFDDSVSQGSTTLEKGKDSSKSKRKRTKADPKKIIEAK